MRESTIRILTLVAVLLLAGVATAGDGVWISDKGNEFKVGPHAVFLDEEGDYFDLSELEDGETRVFGKGDKQITASRTGDTILLERPAAGDERALRIECEIGQDSCQVMTFGDNSEKVALMIKKRHPGHHAIVTLDEDVIVGEDGEATVIVKRIGDCDDCCDDPAADCIAERIEMHTDTALEGEMVIEVVASGGGDLHKNVWVHGSGQRHGHHALMHTEGATKHDLSELYDGETRIFGSGERQLTAVREGDEITITRPNSEAIDDELMTCSVGRDSCFVMTYEDDPERVAVVLGKSAGCGTGEDCGADVLLQLMGGRSGNVEIIEIDEGASGHLIVDDPDADRQTIRRIKIVREEDD